MRTFDDPTVTVTDRFGFSVTQDGNHILIGAPGDNGNGHDVGQAYLLETTTGSLVHTFDDPTVTDSDLFGGAVALDGNHVLIAASIDDTNGTNVGQTHLFEANTGVLLHTFDDPTPTDSDFFGRAVALHGNRAAVGAPFDDTHRTDSGQAHLFAVPEPSLGILLASAVLGLAVVRRREPIH